MERRKYTYEIHFNPKTSLPMAFQIFMK